MSVLTSIAEEIMPIGLAFIAKILDYQMPNDQKSLSVKKMYVKQLGQLFFLKNITQFYNKVNFKV